jgi:hypothetical protein
MGLADIALTSVLGLPNFVKLPKISFSVPLSPNNQCTSSVLGVLNADSQHIDTVQYYDDENQVGVGEGTLHTLLVYKHLLIAS